jgi:hypothetical protein
MDNIPVNSVIGYIGLALLVFGVFMVLTGFDIISIQQVTVKKGKKTWALGIVFTIIGIVLLMPEVRATTPVLETIQPAESTPLPTTVSIAPDTGQAASGNPVVFDMPDNSLWNKTNDGSYTVIGNQDTIAWSTVTVEGDLELSFDIQFQGPNGEGNIILYGNGSGLSDKQLFFGFSPVLSKIMAGTPYDTRYLDDIWMTDVDVNKKHAVMIRIVNQKASLFFDGTEILTAFAPTDLSTSGKIGLYKYQGETGQGDNGATYSNFRLTASMVTEP